VSEITPRRGAIFDEPAPCPMSISRLIRHSRCPPSLATSNGRRGCWSAVWNSPGSARSSPGESSHSLFWIARKLPPEKNEAVEALHLKGVYFQKENQRIYQKRELARTFLGFAIWDENGLGGIEYELDGQIRAGAKKSYVMADARQRWFDGGEAQRERGAHVVSRSTKKIPRMTSAEWRWRLPRQLPLPGRWW